MLESLDVRCRHWKLRMLPGVSVELISVMIGGRLDMDVVERQEG